MPAFEDGDRSKGYLFASFRNSDNTYSQTTGIAYSPSSDLSLYPNSWIDVGYGFNTGYYVLQEDMLISDTSQYDITLKGPVFTVRPDEPVVLDRVLNQWTSTEGNPWHAQLEVARVPDEAANFMICWSVRSPKVLRRSCNTFDRQSAAQVGSLIVDDSDVSGFGGPRGVVTYKSIAGFTWATATRLLQIRELWLSR